MKPTPWLIFLFAATTLFAAAPTPAELGARAAAFLQTGRDIHVAWTGFFTDGGSSEVMLADASGQTLDLIMLNQRRALREGGIFGAYEPKHEREYVPTGEAQTAFRQALISALHRSHVTNPDTRRLLGALTSLFPTYGGEVRWSASGPDASDAAGPLISGPRFAVFATAIGVLGLGLAWSIGSRKRRTAASAM